jgi:hypothetical protein
MEEPPPTPVASRKKEWNPSVWSFLCLVVGVILLFVSPALLIIAGPLFLACFVLSIIAMAKRRVFSGVLMMVLVFIIPPVCFLGALSHRVSTSMKKTAEERSAVAGLIFEEVNGSRDGSYNYVKGVVRNKGASPVDSAKVQVSWLDKDGTVLDTGETALEKLEPGDAKSFQIQLRSNPKMSRYTYRIASQ